MDSDTEWEQEWYDAGYAQAVKDCQTGGNPDPESIDPDLAELIRAWQSCGQASQEEVLDVLCTQEIGPGAAPAYDLLEALHCMEPAEGRGDG
jgi:hypothetical protein